MQTLVTPILRRWRYAILGAAVALCLYTTSFLADLEYTAIGTWRGTPWIDRVGFVEFVEGFTGEAEEAGWVREEVYKVPPQFGVGTKSNFTSDLFPTRVVGRSFNAIDLPKDVIRTQSGNATTMDGETFNPAILKMPRGMAPGWEYIVVARGPRRQRMDMWVPEANRYAEEHGLVAFPATLSPSGQFIPTLSAQPLFLPIATHRNNTSCGYWTFPFGPQDPRLYFTDSGRPAMSFSMNARREGRCRSVGWVGDLRSVWGELRGAMEGVDASLARPWSEGDEEEFGVHELEKDGMANMEKNWMGFFPGAEPNSSTTLPEYHYSLVPGRTLHPSTQTPETLQYTLRPSPAKSSCVADKLYTDVPNVNTIHHATPLYRMTLCGRRDPACVPRVGNTVLVGLGQVKVVHELGQRYGRFFVMWNVTEPYEYLAVGPMIRWFDTPDAEIVYAMSLVFSPPAPRTIFQSRADTAREAQVGPMHGFLDDELFVTIGVMDNEMGSVVMRAGDAVVGMRVC